MKNHLILPFLSLSLLLAACGQKDASATAAAATDAAAGSSFEFTAADNMKFNMVSFEVKAGQDVKVILTNMGTLPKAAMAHNWILLKKGVDAKAFVDAAITAAASDYFPTQLADEVIAHTKLLGAKQSDEVSFKAPMEPGEYTFVCSFPAHYLSGMHGVMVVK
jgi:azurin